MKFLENLCREDNDDLDEIIYKEYWYLLRFSIYPFMKSKKWRIISILNTIFSLLSLLFLMILCIITSYKERKNLLEFSTKLHYALLMALFAGILILLVMSRPKLAHVQKYISIQMSEYDETIEYRRKEFKKSFKRKKQLLLKLLIYSTIVVGSMLLILKPYIDDYLGFANQGTYSETGVSLNLPVSIWFPVGTDTYLTYSMALALEAHVTMIVSIEFLSGDLLYFNFCLSLAFEVNHLKYSLKHLSQRAMYLFKLKHGDTIVDLNNIILKNDLTKFYKECFKQNIIHHQKIIRLFRVFNDLVGWFAVMLVFSGAVIIGVSVASLLFPNLGQPQMLVVGDTQEMFMPLLDGFLADIEESASLIDALMTQIPNMFANTKETETILAPAIQAGLEALKASNRAGKLLVFHSSLPICEAPGKLKNRDDRKLLGTEKEKTVLTPQNTVYNNLGQECVAVGCSVDLFILNNSYVDLPTIGQVARLTGGEVYKYTYFQAELDGERLVTDVQKDIRRLCAFDAIMRVRTSTGVRPTDFFGHFFMSNTTDVELASVDPDKAIALEVKHDDKLAEEEGVYIQAALLYTSLTGQRRIRVLNLALKSCSQMTELYRACELDTVINFFSKQSVYKLLDSTPKAVKESLIVRSAQMLACYRKNCASPTSPGQLILPECMKLLPLYINCLLKCDAVSGGSDLTIDDKWFAMAAVMTMDIPSSLNYIYPKLVSLHDMEDDCPSSIRCSAEKLTDDGVYLLENGIYMFLWLGLAVPSQWVMSVFGVQSTAQIDTEKSRLPLLDNPLSEKIRSLISNICSSRHRTMRLTIVRQRDKMEIVMKHFLVEDKGIDGSSSYVDFLCHLHKEIRSLLS